MNIVNDYEMENLKKYTFAVYILQALGFVTGGLTAIAGLIVNYIKYDDIRGTWLQSHFDWQKSTFWYGLLWGIVGALGTIILVGHLVLFILGFWFIYRIAKGWVYLVDGKEMY